MTSSQPPKKSDYKENTLNIYPTQMQDEYVSSDGFLRSFVPSGEAWNRQMPYQLMILEAQLDGSYNVLERFTLPITPEALTVATPYAIQTTVTLKGILEEHNASPLVQISFSGTTGVWPYRMGPKDEPPLSPLKSAVLSTATGAAVSGIIDRFKSTFLGGAADTANSGPPTALGDVPHGLQGTGYYQFHLLSTFLERYAHMKKGSATIDKEHGLYVKDPSRLRLAVCMWKDQWVWLVTPRQFTLSRSAADPMLYRYSFQATGWKKIDLERGTFPPNEQLIPATRSPSKLQNIFNQIRAARAILQDTKAAIQAVRADVQSMVFNPIRETILTLKEVIGIPATIMDMPGSIVEDFQSTVVANWEGLRDSIPGSMRTTHDKAFLAARSIQSGQPEPRPPAGSAATGASGADPITSLFKDPDSNPDLFDNVEVSNMDVDLSLQRLVDAERERVAAFQRQDFLRIRAGLQDVADDLADHIGMGSATYNSVKGRPAPKATSHQPTGDEVKALFALQQVCQQIDRLTANLTMHENAIPSSFEYVKGLADRSGIAFDIPNGKYAVPLPFGSSMEQLSARYLGDPDRWMEIVTTNSLQPPYIDEDGFVLTLLSNGSGSQIQVSSAENLYVGQPVKLYSGSVPLFRRAVVSVETVSPGSVIVTLDGEPTLDSLTVADGAAMRAYLPGTINSEQLVYIPSQGRAEDDLKIVSVSSEAEADRLTKVSKVDLLLDNAGDIVVSGSGEAKLAFGLTNLVQAARLKVSTPQGSLLHYPSFGIAVEPGMSTADLTVDAIADSIKTAFASDPRFSSVGSVRVKIAGPSVTISAEVGVSGSVGLLPINVEMTR